MQRCQLVPAQRLGRELPFGPHPLLLQIELCALLLSCHEVALCLGRSSCLARRRGGLQGDGVWHKGEKGGAHKANGRNP